MGKVVRPPPSAPQSSALGLGGSSGDSMGLLSWGMGPHGCPAGLWQGGRPEGGTSSGWTVSCCQCCPHSSSAVSWSSHCTMGSAAGSPGRWSARHPSLLSLLSGSVALLARLHESGPSPHDAVADGVGRSGPADIPLTQGAEYILPCSLRPQSHGCGVPGLGGCRRSRWQRWPSESTSAGMVSGMLGSWL